MKLLIEYIHVLLESRTIPSFKYLIKSSSLLREWISYLQYSGIEFSKNKIEREKEIKNCAMQELENLYDKGVSAIKNLGQGSTLWRCMSLPKEVNPEQLSKYGIYWTDDETAAECHWGGSTKDKIDYVFEIKLINLNSVDIKATLLARMRTTGEDEAEITLIEGSKVLLFGFGDEKQENGKIVII